MLWFCVAAMAVIAGLMIAQARRSARELELGGLLETWRDVHQARAERWVTVEDLPMLTDWITGEKKPPLQRKLQWRMLKWGWVPPWVQGWEDYDFKGWALKGFEILGTNAAPAIPQLMEAVVIRRGEDEVEDEVAFALGLIGEPAWEIAYELAKGGGDSRGIGAFLLGGIGSRPEESREILLQLTKDPDEAVRKCAYAALAEFSNEKTEAMFGEMLRCDDETKVRMGAYGLHMGGEASVKMLVDAYESATNDFAKDEVLATFALRDDAQGLGRFAVSRFWGYQEKRGWFESPHIEVRSYLRSYIERGEPVEALWRAVRERVLAGQNAEVEKEIFRVRRAAGRSKSRDAEDWRIPK
jgi:hypothetical protein